MREKPDSSLSAEKSEKKIRALFSHIERREHERERREELDEHVEGRPGGILERVADGIADNCRLVRLAPLAAEDPALDVLLRVVPGSTAVVQDKGHEDSGNRGDHEERGHRLVLEHEPYEYRESDRKDPRRHHVP
jgi:hypothetical protein